MLKEIIRNPKSKAVIAAVIVFSLIALISCGVQPKKENNSLTSKKTESEEFSTTYGKWKIAEYIGESVEYHGSEATTKAEKNENEKIIKEIKGKYLNKELHIDSKNITAFSPPTELGYHVLTRNDVFSIYRQPSNMGWHITAIFMYLIKP